MTANIRGQKGLSHGAQTWRAIKQIFTILPDKSGMTLSRANIIRAVLRSAVVLLALNEIRGIILAIPVFYAMYQSGGSMMAIWLGISTLGGIALSVVIPMLAVRKLESRLVLADGSDGDRRKPS